MVNPSALTLAPASDGSHELNMVVAACTFDKKGWPVKFMHDDIHRKLDAKQYELLRNNAFPQRVTVPGEKAEAVRLLVKDVPSGRLGSVTIALDDHAAAHPPDATGSITQHQQ